MQISTRGGISQTPGSGGISQTAGSYGINMKTAFAPPAEGYATAMLLTALIWGFAAFVLIGLAIEEHWHGRHFKR